MNRIAIPHGAFVFVGDGQKALFLRNAGDEKFPNLKTERVFVEENPPTHEQGTDRPGRAFNLRAHTRIAAAAWKQRTGTNWRNIGLRCALRPPWKSWYVHAM